MKSFVKFLKPMVQLIIGTVILICILAGLECNTKISENIINYLLIAGIIVIIFGVNLINIRKIKSKGWLYGLSIGIAYVVILYLGTSMIINDFTISKYFIFSTSAVVLSSIAGSVIGINLKI